MGINTTEIIAVVFAVLVVFCGIGAGIGGRIVEQANGSYAQGLAEKTGTELTKLTASDGSSVAVFRTTDGIYINALSMINAFHGNSDTVIVYNVNGDQILDEQSAPITFNHAAGIFSSSIGTILINLAMAGQK